jgi:hypothetical protein
MATVINTTPREASDNGSGFLLGILMLIVFAVLFFVYGLPYMTGAFRSAGPTVNIPDKVNVNVQQPGK